MAPDRAIVYFALLTTDSEPSAAAAAAAALRVQLANALAPLGVRGADLATWGYGVGVSGGFRNAMRMRPDMASVPEEYGARVGIRLVVDSLARLDAIVSAALENGGVSVPMVTFTAREPVEARAAAVAQAFESAHRDATALARAAGGELGELLSMTSTETPNYGNQFMTLYQGMQGLEIPLQPNDVTVRMMINVAWRFRP